MFGRGEPLHHRCKLLRESPEGAWLELSEISLVTVTRTSLQLRSPTGSLQSDIPSAGVSKLVQIGVLMRLHLVGQSRKLALKLETLESMEKFSTDLRNHNFPQIVVSSGLSPPICVQLNDKGIGFPTSKDPSLHQLVWELLSKKEFRGFVDEVSVVLSTLQQSLTMNNK